MMPVMDGIETLKRLKEMDSVNSQGVPVIALTANAISGVRNSYLEAGFHDYLSKPIVGDALERMLCRYLPPEKVCKAEETTAPQVPAAEEEAESGQITELLNVANGLVYSGDSREMYADFLGLFAESQKEKKHTLQAAFEEQDMNQYAILIHGIKSNAFSIGGDALGELAKELEREAKNSNWAFIEKHHQAAQDLYEKTARAAEQWLQEQADEK
jgi:CheY-like chemotaxis protein